MKAAGLKGVIVTAVDPEGIAAESLQQGDIILSINQKRVANIEEYGRAVKDAEQRGSAALLVKRGDASLYVVLRLR
jgi:S1-C subfamily serine protease